MNIIKPLLLIALLILTLTACKNQTIMQQSTIEKVLVCTQPSGNWASGPIHSMCRVQLVNGDRLTLRAPVAEGDVIQYYRERHDQR